jgi:hypothetical protein
LRSKEDMDLIWARLKIAAKIAKEIKDEKKNN